jgi:hypothetical protein
MKLITSIAAAASVIGTSFIAANPAEANGWIYSGQSNDGVAIWVRPRGCSGTICNFQAKTSATNFVDDLMVDCVGRKWKREDENAWNDLYPQSLLDGGVSKVCR